MKGTYMAYEKPEIDLVEINPVDIQTADSTPDTNLPVG